MQNQLFLKSLSICLILSWVNSLLATCPDDPTRNNADIICHLHCPVTYTKNITGETEIILKSIFMSEKYQCGNSLQGNKYDERCMSKIICPTTGIGQLIQPTAFTGWTSENNKLQIANNVCETIKSWIPEQLSKNKNTLLTFFRKSRNKNDINYIHQFGTVLLNDDQDGIVHLISKHNKIFKYTVNTVPNPRKVTEMISEQASFKKCPTFISVQK